MATEPCGEGCLHLNTFDHTDSLPDYTPDEYDYTPPVVEGQLERYARGVAFLTKDSGAREQYESGMVRDTTEGKTKWHLITSGPMLKRWAELMTRGAEKYDDDNWMKADSIDEYLRFKASAMRHFMQWYFGDSDEDHAAAVMFNMNGAEYVNDVMDADVTRRILDAQG